MHDDIYYESQIAVQDPKLIRMEQRRRRGCSPCTASTGADQPDGRDRQEAGRVPRRHHGEGVPGVAAAAAPEIGRGQYYPKPRKGDIRCPIRPGARSRERGPGCARAETFGRGATSRTLRLVSIHWPCDAGSTLSVLPARWNVRRRREPCGLLRKLMSAAVATPWILMRAAGLDPRVDPPGNIFGRRAGTDPSLPPILFQTHRFGAERRQLRRRPRNAAEVMRTRVLADVNVARVVRWSWSV